MASSINSTSAGNGGLVSTGDDSGILNIQTNETTAITVDASQRVAFVAGTAALPAITTDGDTNTGIYFPTADTIAFTEGGAESMRIDSSGNVGIGTSSPNARLEALSSTVGAEISRFEGNYTASGTVNLTNWRRSGGAVASVMRYNDANTDMEFGTTTSHSQAFITGGTERMRILSTGQVLIDRTTNTDNGKVEIYGDSDGAFNPLTILQGAAGSASRTSINFYRTAASASVGTIQTTNTATSYNTSSDYRLKENIAPMMGALAKVAQLKPVTYKWKIDGAGGEGFIAHELAEVCPHAVSGEKDATREQEYEVTPAVKDEEGNITTPAVMGTRTVPDYQGIDVSFLVATLTAAIQELKQINDTQAETINALTARIVALEQA